MNFDQCHDSSVSVVNIHANDEDLEQKKIYERANIFKNIFTENNISNTKVTYMSSEIMSVLLQK